MTQIRRVYLALSVFLALSLLLVVLVIFAVNNLPLFHPAARPVVGANTHPPGAAGASVAKVNGVSATKSTTSLTGALTGAMSMTGTITLAGDAATAYTVVDAFQALPAGSFYQGTYTISFTCSPGTGASTTETIGAGGSFGAPASLPPSHSEPPTITTDESGNATCEYAVNFSGSTPEGSIASIRNDIWIGCNSVLCLTSAAGASIPPADAIVPEAPIAALLPLTGFALLGLVFFVVARRRGNASELSE